MAKAPVHLVAEEPGPGGAGDFHQLPEEGLLHHRAGGVVGVIDIDELHPAPGGSHQAPQLLRVREPSCFLPQPQDVHLGPDGFRDGVVLLVGGQHRNHLVPWLHQSEHGEGVGPDGPVGDGNLLRGNALVQSGNGLAQPGAAFNIPIGEAGSGQLLQHSLPPAGKVQQLPHAQGLDAGFRQVILAMVFVGVHPNFHAEVSNLHGFSSRRKIVAPSLSQKNKESKPPGYPRCPRRRDLLRKVREP